MIKDACLLFYGALIGAFTVAAWIERHRSDTIGEQLRKAARSLKFRRQFLTSDMISTYQADLIVDGEAYRLSLRYEAAA